MWQPIETAPTDGTILDLWIFSELLKNGYRATNCVWIDIDDDRLQYSGWVKAKDDFRSDRFIQTLVERATHWMPLPEPPQ